MNPFEHLEGLVSGKLSIIKMVVDIAKLEARLAGLSIYPLLLTLCLLLIVLMSTWLAAMLLVGYGIKLALHNSIWAISSVLLINMSVLILLLNYLLFNLKKMSFEKTRAYFSEKESDHHEKLEKTSDRKDSDNGKEIKGSTNQSHST